jgi:hypothetical protein
VPRRDLQARGISDFEARLRHRDRSLRCWGVGLGTLWVLSTVVWFAVGRFDDCLEGP